MKGLKHSLVAMALWLAAGPAMAETAAAPLTWHEAVQAGLAASPELKQAEAELNKAMIGLQGAQAERFQYSSDVTIGDRYGVLGLLSNQTPVAANTPIANGMLMAKVPLFTGFRLSERIHQAEAGVAGTRARADQARQDLIWAITEAYWQAHRAQLRLAIQSEAVDQARKSRDVVKTSYAIGQASGNELDRVEVSLLNQESDLLRAEGEVLAARDKLSALLQRDLTDVALAPPPAPGTIQPAAFRPTQALAEAVAHRPDVRAARAQLEAQEAAVTIAEADRWPQLDLVSAYQHGNNPFIATSQNHDVLSSFVGTWDARLNLSFHLFDHGLIDRNVGRARADVEAARQSLETAKRRAELEVKQALRNLDLAKRRIALGERSETLATANLKWLEGRFKFGYALPVELNEARVNLVTARTQRVDAQIDHQLAQAALQRAMGQLQPPPEPPPMQKLPIAP